MGKFVFLTGDVKPTQNSVEFSCIVRQNRTSGSRVTHHRLSAIMLISMLIRLLISIISRTRQGPRSGTTCPILMQDTSKICRILCRFQIHSQKYQFPHSKKLIFLPYANLCKLGDYIVHTGFKDAGPLGDQICQICFRQH